MERTHVSPRASYWQELLQTHRDSGLSVKEFCAQQNVSVAAFYQWRRRFEQPTQTASEPSSGLIPVRIVSSQPARTSPVGVQILTPTGFSLRVDGNTSPEQLLMILQAIEASSQGGQPC